jgi:hypothetical protein
MCPLMDGERRRHVERLATCVAHEGSLVTVEAKVDLERILLPKLLITEFARVWFLARVDQNMFFELMRFGELFEAEFTSVRLFFLVSSFVLLHLVDILSVEATVCTLVVVIRGIGLGTPNRSQVLHHMWWGPHPWHSTRPQQMVAMAWMVKVMGMVQVMMTMIKHGGRGRQS